jgi:hypothetical protein
MLLLICYTQLFIHIIFFFRIISFFMREQSKIKTLFFMREQSKRKTLAFLQVCQEHQRGSKSSTQISVIQSFNAPIEGCTQGRLNDFGALGETSKLGLFFFLSFFFFFWVGGLLRFFFLAPCNELVFFSSIFSSFSNHWYLNIMMN